jgi:hypothetical protein
MNVRGLVTTGLWRCLAAIGCLCVLGVDNPAGAPRGRPRPDLGVGSEEEAKLKRLNKQLDDILEVQAAMLKHYDELVEELRTVKIRATQ